MQPSKPDVQPSQAPPGTSRRVALCALAAGLVAGCSDEGGNDADSRDLPAIRPATGADRVPLADTGDIPIGGGKLVGQVLLVQPAAGTVRAFNAICPHRGARVSPP